MKASCTKKLPQVGTAGSAGGESHPPSGGCPSYSGGGTNRFALLAQTDDQGKLIKDTDVSMKEARVVLTRCSSGEDVVSGAKMANLSDSDSDMSCHTATSEASSGRFWKRKRSDSAESHETLVSPSLSPARRGRGRPPTTGQYVGLAKAKAALNEAKAEEIRLQAEMEMAEELRRKRDLTVESFRKRPDTREIVPLGQADEFTDLETKLLSSTEMITKVATTSSNLKGTYIRALKDGVKTIRSIFEELRARTITDEVARLEAANKRLANELNDVRSEMAELRRRSQRSTSTPAPPTLEEIKRTIMVECGTMVNARIDGLEERLLPAIRLRPPLAADRRKSPDVPVAAPPVVEPTIPPRIVTRRPAKKVAKAREENATAPAPPPQPLDQGWNVVVARKKKGPKKTQEAQRPVARPQAPSKTQPKAQPKLRPPRTSAVVVTLQPSAVERGITYSQVLSDARSRVDIAALGIGAGLRIRTAVTGARILQLPASVGAESADSLAKSIQESIGEDVVRVSRPERCVEMRVTGLDDSATKEEVVTAVAKVGGCAEGAIKAGEVVRQPGRQGTVWLKCPIAAAKRATEGRILVGWVSALAKVLEPRPIRCFRCLEVGHVGAICSSSVDRSGLCFCCGKTGHKAAACLAEPHCPICEEAGVTASHRIGAKTCTSTVPKKGKRGSRTARVGPRAPSQVAMHTVHEENGMDTGI